MYSPSRRASSFPRSAGLEPDYTGVWLPGQVLSGIGVNGVLSGIGVNILGPNKGKRRH